MHGTELRWLVVFKRCHLNHDWLIIKEDLHISLSTLKRIVECYEKTGAVSYPGANDPAVFKQGSQALPEFCIRADQNKLRPSTCRLEPDKRGDVVNLVNVDLASAPGLLRARFMPCADCPRSSGSGPPRPMPVRQSWGESVLAPGGYGPSSMRRHLLLLAARWALCGSSSRSRSRSSACISAHMHLCTARSTQALVARVAARGSSRRYASVHLRRPRPLPQTGLQSLRRHVKKARHLCTSVCHG